jgi:hypothetical protein
MAQRGDRRQVRKPTFTARELSLIVLGLLCVVGQAIVYRGQHPGTAARVVTVLLGFAVLGFFVTFAWMVLRRERAARRSAQE